MTQKLNKILGAKAKLVSDGSAEFPSTRTTKPDSSGHLSIHNIRSRLESSLEFRGREGVGRVSSLRKCTVQGGEGASELRLGLRSLTDYRRPRSFSPIKPSKSPPSAC